MNSEKRWHSHDENIAPLMNKINRPAKLTRIVSLAEPSNFGAECENNFETDFQTVSKSVPIERSDLLKASMNGNTERVQYLLKQDIDINQQDAEGNTALLLASEGGHTETVQLLLDNYARVNGQQEGMSTSMKASQHRHMDKAAVNMKGSKNYHHNALTLASKNGHTEVAKLLLDHHAQVEMQDSDGWSSLMYASQAGHAEVAKLLL